MPVIEVHERLIKALIQTGAIPSDRSGIERIDTHISTLLLSGQYVYKIKKPLNLGFLDFSTLDRREQSCRDEVRLNRRFAPDIYLGVCAITGDPEKPQLNRPGKEQHSGEVIEWAVMMRRFESNALLSDKVSELGRGLIERLAVRLAHFHHQAAVSSQSNRYGSPESIYAPMVQNFSQIRSRRSSERRQLDDLSNWCEQAFSELRQIMDARHRDGSVRECHGDLHLGNITLIDGEPVPFDGIEFNEELRWIDVFNDLAFLTMDLTRVGRNDLARWLRSAYLQETGDYGGLLLLRFYEVYRAMVRAKVLAIRSSQQDLSMAEREQLTADYKRYLRIAESYTRPGLRALIITQGVAASGKSTLSGSLIGKLPAVRVRSDVERKRLAGLPPEARVLSEQSGAIYNADMTARTYDRLADCAEQIIQAGFIAIVDATFLKKSYRQRFADLATKLNVPFVILSCDLPEAELRHRLENRQQSGRGPSDATLDVLITQIRNKDPLSGEEQAYSLDVNPAMPLELDDLIRRLR